MHLGNLIKALAEEKKLTIKIMLNMKRANEEIDEKKRKYNSIVPHRHAIASLENNLLTGGSVLHFPTASSSRRVLR